MRLYQSIHKMQDRLDETFLRASDTKQMGREIIKNTEDLLRGTTNKVGHYVFDCTIILSMFKAPLMSFYVFQQSYIDYYRNNY